MKLIYLCFALLFFLPLVHASDDYRPQGVTFDIQQPCTTSNGTFCSSTAQCNLTAFYPNSTLLVNNTPMTNRIAFHNYTMNGQFIQTNGLYPYTILCTDGTYSGNGNFQFIVNNTGTAPSLTSAMVYFTGLIVAIVIFLLALNGAVKIPWRNQENDYGYVIGINEMKYLKLALWFVSYLLLLLITFLSWNISYELLNFSLLGNMMQAIYWILLSLLFPTLGILFIVCIVRIVDDVKINKALSRHLSYKGDRR